MKLFGKNKRKCLYSYQSEMDNLRTQVALTKVYSTAMTILCCVFCILFMKSNNYFVNETNEIVMNAQREIQNVENYYKTMESNYDYLCSQYDSMVNTIDELTAISNKLDEENKKVVEANETYIERLKIFRDREELYNKYDYAIMDRSGKRTDITYEQLVKLEDLVEDSSINDTDLILAQIMTESTGNEKAQNASSTAKGFGQFLNGTSKFVYTDLMNRSDWTPNVALDGYTNMEMMVAYYDYLYEQNNGNLYDMIKRYSGSTTSGELSAYVSKLDSYLLEKDKSINQLSKSFKQS